MNEYYRTRGSVRGSLAALAGLTTTPWEAAVTMQLHPSGWETRREVESSELPMSGGSSARLEMACPTHVNCEQASSTRGSQRTLTGSGQNRHAVGCPTNELGHADTMTAGVLQGLNHRLLRELDGVNPLLRPIGASASARAAFATPGKGYWRKRTPFCNRTDSSAIAALREQAYFQLVVHYETTGRTDAGGNRK